MERFYLDISKENLQKMVNELDWGEPKGKYGKHYLRFKGTIFDRTNDYGNDVKISLNQTLEQKKNNEPERIFFNGKTQRAMDNFFQSRKAEKGKGKAKKKDVGIW